jgi:hypothetical protein
MAAEYLVLAVALTRPASPDYVVRAPARIVLAESVEDAQAQGLLWALEELPPQFGWEGHALRVELLDRLRPMQAGEL